MLRKRDYSGLYVMLFVIGAPIYLIMEHPVVMWCAFVPLGILFIYKMYKFLSNPASGIGHFLTAMLVLVIMVILLVIVGLL